MVVVEIPELRISLGEIIRWMRLSHDDEALMIDCSLGKEEKKLTHMTPGGQFRIPDSGFRTTQRPPPQLDRNPNFIRELFNGLHPAVHLHPKFNNSGIPEFRRNYKKCKSAK